MKTKETIMNELQALCAGPFGCDVYELAGGAVGVRAINHDNPYTDSILYADEVFSYCKDNGLHATISSFYSLTKHNYPYIEINI